MSSRYLNGDTGFSVALILCGLYWMMGAVPLGFWTGFTPASGFAPFLYGAALSGLAGVNLFKSLRTPGQRDESVSGGIKPLKIIIIMAVALLGLEVAGFVPTIFLALMTMFVLVEHLPWVRSAVVAALVTGGLYLLFETWLGVPLPTGAWSF